MGLFGLWGGRKKEEELSVEEKNAGEERATDKQILMEKSKGGANIGNKEVARAPSLPAGPTATDVSVFEFGTAGENEDKVTLAGYCPVSDDTEPCRWELLPAKPNRSAWI